MRPEVPDHPPTGQRMSLGVETFEQEDGYPVEFFPPTGTRFYHPMRPEIRGMDSRPGGSMLASVYYFLLMQITNCQKACGLKQHTCIISQSVGQQAEQAQLRSLDRVSVNQNKGVI